MEDDDDIEFLRLAALKSLNVKKEPAVTHFHRHIHQNQYNRRPILGNAIQVLDNIPSQFICGNGYTNGPLHRHFPNHNNGPLLADPPLNEPYVPQRIGMNGKCIDTTTPYDYVPYVPMSKVAPSIPNVQLSPRSAAFVSQNNDILKRRKGGLSPHRSGSPLSPQYRSRSPSPTYRPNSPRYASPGPKFPTGALSASTWSSRHSSSRSPPPFRRLSPGRPNKPISRSPPPLLNRHFSRSPKRTVSPTLRPRYSPSFRRSTSFSPPIVHRSQPLPSSRMHSRSPPPSFRRPSPSPRSIGVTSQPLHKQRRGHSPAPIPASQHIHHRNAPANRSPGPTTGSPSYRSNMRRRTRSPKPDASAITKHRSNSRSPPRKHSKPSALRDTRERPPAKRRSPAHGSRKHPRASGSVRNNQRSRPAKRSASPVTPLQQQHQPKRRQPSKSPQPTQVRNVSTSNRSKSIQRSETPDITMKKSTESLNEEQTDIVQSVATVQSEEQLEEELLASTDEEEEREKSDNEDEIDLFASEESESENEGRFKSNSSKNERPTNSSTLSFSKLGSASASMVLDLNDVVKTDNSFGGERGGGGGRRRGDRNSDDRYRGRNNYSSRSGRDDRYRGRRNEGGNGRGSAYKPKTAGSSSTTRKSEDRKKDERSMFKSTFQSVESTTKESGKPEKMDVPSSVVVSSVTVKSSSREHDRDRNVRNVIQLKRPNATKEPEREKVQLSSLISAPSSTITVVASTVPTAVASQAAADSAFATASSSDDGAAKKAIHLRLGAMTKTWKNKKSWRSEKV